MPPLILRTANPGFAPMISYSSSLADSTTQRLQVLVSLQLIFRRCRLGLPCAGVFASCRAEGWQVLLAHARFLWKAYAAPTQRVARVVTVITAMMAMSWRARFAYLGIKVLRNDGEDEEDNQVSWCARLRAYLAIKTLPGCCEVFLLSDKYRTDALSFPTRVSSRSRLIRKNISSKQSNKKWSRILCLHVQKMYSDMLVERAQRAFPQLLFSWRKI